MAPTLFDEFFTRSPDGLDVEAIRREWLALRPPFDPCDRHPPLPVWARRGLTESGPQAWDSLREILQAYEPSQAMCVYIHVPFCARKCAFCDCYSFALNRRAPEHIEAYTACLEQEIALWGRQGGLSRRPVSTVHFGGGTPTFLGASSFRRVVEQCKAALGTSPATEWALETTSSEFDPPMQAALEEMGFTRLHLGVQSLDDGLRQTLGRREPAGDVLNKITGAVRRGWIASVDLIVGLPGQTLASIYGDIQRLIEAGVDGFSVYELQRSERNRHFWQRSGEAEPDRFQAYLLFQAACAWLEAAGFHKNLFNHFARRQDANLYFTFPERGEDCLALGAIADGVFGDYHFRHPEYLPYLRGAGPDFPGLQGGTVKTDFERRIKPLEVALLSGRLRRVLFEEILGREWSERLFAAWLAQALVRPLDGEKTFELTANGSWLAGDMLGMVGSRLCD